MKLKLWCCIAILFLATVPAFADGDAPVMQAGYSTKHDLSLPLTEMVKMVKPITPQGPRVIPIQKIDLTKRAHPPALAFDPLVAPVTPAAPMPAPILSFAGPDADALDVLAGRVAPPDTEGDVGANHYISYVNLIWQVFDKTTGASVLGPFLGNSFWVGFGGVCETTNNGDPIVLWDQFANRWMVSQFAINSGVQCIAVSQTSDPTGAWHRYAFDISPGANDYPKFGVWPDGYYLSFNEFNPSFTASVAVAFEKDKMIAGQAAQFVKFVNPAPAGSGCSGAGDCYFSIQPAHIEGIVPPPVGTPNYFVMAFDDETWGTAVGGTDSYKIWKFHVDWTTPANSTWTGPTTVNTPEFNANMCNFAECVVQPSPGELLDTLSQFTMYRAVYRNFGTHEAMYVSHTANVGANKAGVRWAELRDPATTPTVFQTGTHSPADAHSRWMGSVSADKDGNIAIGYSISSSTKMPSIGIAGRLASDPLGTLPQEELEILTGTGVQQATANRWGDYSTMSVDESDNCTFWYHTEYYQTTGSFDWDTHIASFKFPSCTNGPTGTISGTVTSSANGALLAGASIVVGGLYATTTNASGVYSMTLPVGTYDVVASKFGYSTETALGVVIADGQTTTQDFALAPAAAVTLDGFVTADGAGWPLYAKVTVAAAGGNVVLYTNPQNGYYSTEVLADTAYTITVEAVQPGYAPETRPIMTTIADQQENFQLKPDATCSLPGYGITNAVAANDFTTGISPPFSVITTTTICTGAPELGWNTNNAGGRANLNGGTPPFAIADSDDCGSGAKMNTIMETNTFDLTTNVEPLQIRFNSDYNNLCTVSAGDAVSLDIWNGTAWTTVFNFCGASRRGPRVESFSTVAGNGAAAAKVRWRYVAGWDWWWQVDNVLVTKGAPLCEFTDDVAGGIIYGNVYDENTGLPLVGAVVTADTGATTMTTTTPNDPNIDDGFFMLHVPLTLNAPGVRVLTVTMPNYGTVSQNVIPTPGGSVMVNFQLPAGMLSSPTTALRMRLPIGGDGNSILTVNNTGNLDANVSILELDAPVVESAAPNGPFDTVTLPYDQETKEGLMIGMARNTRDLSLPTVGQYPTTMQGAGDFINEYPTGLTGPWGNGVDLDLSELWVSNPTAVGGDDLAYNYLFDGTPTGETVNEASSGGLWVGDMAYNSRTRTMWQVNVGGDNCIAEFDPVALTLTGNKICPAFGTSMRGLAYDAVSNTYYAGSWNGTQVIHFTPAGAILRKVNVGLAVSGLAFNASTGHLFAQVNASSQLVYVLDANGATFPVLSAFALKNGAGANGFDAFAGAGIELDCAGRLWSVQQNSLTVFVNDSGETGPCVTQIDWLSEDPVNFVVPAQGSAESVVSFNADGQNPGCQEAQLLLLNDTPYGPLQIPAGLTVEFNDVPFGAFGDAYIHAVAGQGITLGCGGGNFCPTTDMTRRTMAVWLLRSKFGADYTPPPATGVFADVSPESFAADFIEDLYARGITTGCSTSPLLYCPDLPTTRIQMAVFLLRTKEGSSYTPPACEGLFADVPCSHPQAGFAEELYRRGVTTGCIVDPLSYCPNSATSRAQMAVFVTRMFGFPLCQQ